MCICRAKNTTFSESIQGLSGRGAYGGILDHFPSGRVALALELVNGNLDPEDVPAQDVFECLLCGNCWGSVRSHRYATGGPLINHPRSLRHCGRRLSPPAQASGTCQYVQQRHRETPHLRRSQRREGRLADDDIKLSKNAKTLFPGVSSSYREIEIAGEAKLLNILASLQHPGRGRAVLRQPMPWSAIFLSP